MSTVPFHGERRSYKNRGMFGMVEMGTRRPTDLLERAWGLISNVGMGNWAAQDPTWRAAAEKWCEEYHLEMKLRDCTTQQVAGGEK
jgi:hypothetical protein